MSLNDTVNELITQGKQVYEDNVKAFFGTDEDVSARFDTSGWVLRDEVNSADMLNIAQGNDVATELESGGNHPITIGNLLNFDPVEVIIDTRANQPAAGTTDRVQLVTDEQVLERDNGTSWDVIGASSTALEDGGADQLDPTNLDGSAGTSGQFLQTDGTTTSWAEGPSAKFDQAISNGRIFADDGNLYDSVQTAENNATNWMFIGPGTYSEEPTINTAGLAVIGPRHGAVVDGGDAIRFFEIEANNVTVEGLRLTTTGSGPCMNIGRSGTSRDDVTVRDVRLNCGGTGLNANNATRLRVEGVTYTGSFSDAVSLDSGVSESVVDDVVGGAVSDSGTGNVVGEVT